MAWTGIRGGDALPRSSAFLFALAQVQVDPLVWGGQATPDPATLAPLARSPSYRRRTDALTRLASTGRAPVSLVTYGSFSGPRYYRPWSVPGGGAVPMTPVLRQKPTARSTGLEHPGDRAPRPRPCVRSTRHGSTGESRILHRWCHRAVADVACYACHGSMGRRS